MKKFRIIIAGPRGYADYNRVKNEIRYLVRNLDMNEIEIVSGGCSDSKNGVHTYTRNDGTKVYGCDGIGERIAGENGWSVKIFDADWKIYGRSAGPIRNTVMANYATHSLCFWDGTSRGTKDMIDKSEKFDLIGSVVMYDQ